MTLNNLLESLYNLSFTDELYSYIADKLKDKKQQNIHRTFDITRFFPKEYNPYNRKIELRIMTSPIKEKHSIAATEKWTGDDYKVIFYYKTRYRFENVSATEVKRYFYHEITHVIDFLRAKNIVLMSLKKLNKIYTPDNKGRLGVAYRKDYSELNAFINLSAKYAKTFPKSWATIENYEDLMKLMSEKAQFSSPSNEVLKNPHLKRQILARLAREKIIPPNFKY